jgi:hypothetical protein
MADINKAIAGQVSNSEIAGQVSTDALAKTETDVIFINHLGHYLQIAGRLLGFNPITTFYFLQELTTEYKSRWGSFGEA